MAKDYLLSTLTVGRCFTLAPSTDPAPGEPSAEVMSTARSVMTPETVWKVTGAVEGGEVEVVNAKGEAKTLPGKTRVLEQPRQGFDRLVERVRDGEA